MTITERSAVVAAYRRALQLDPAACPAAALAATAQALCLVPEAVADAVLTAADDLPLTLRSGDALDPRAAWPLPAAMEVAS